MLRGAHVFGGLDCTDCVVPEIVHGWEQPEIVQDCAAPRKWKPPCRAVLPCCVSSARPDRTAPTHPAQRSLEHHEKLMDDAVRMQAVLNGSKDDSLLGLDDSDDEKGSLTSTAPDIEAPNDASPTSKGPAAPEPSPPGSQTEKVEPVSGADDTKTSA